MQHTPRKPAGYTLDNGHGVPSHLRTTHGRWIETPKNYHRRDDGLMSHKFWNGNWYETPSIGDLENWLCDGICETPDGDMVEPDHPRSWVMIIGLM
jgi:hypothetical protein